MPDIWTKKVNQQALNALLAGLGLGVGGRGLLGLYNLLNPVKLESNYAPVMLHVPIEHEEEKDKTTKTATEGNKSWNWWNPKDVWDYLRNMPSRIGSGEAAGSVWSHPYGPAMIVGGGAAGVYGGYKLMDYLLRKRKQHIQQKELERAKKEYENALLNKEGSALGRDLDRLYDAVMEKSANDSGLNDPGLAERAASAALGWYLLLAAATAAYAGKKSYDWSRKSQKGPAVRRAQDQQFRDLVGVRPVPPVAQPLYATALSK